MTQQPSIGRIVHYQSYGTPNGEYLPEPRAAIITEIPELLSEQPNSGPDGYVPAVGLCILNPTGQFFNREVPYADEPTPGHWNWPPHIGPAPSVRNTNAQDIDRAIDELAHKAGLITDPKRHGA